MLNKRISLTGNVGKIESKYTDNGTLLCEFSLAVTVGSGDKKSTEWYKCTAWKKTGEIIGEYVDVGSKIQVEGDFKLHLWSAKDGGEARGEIQVTVRDFQLLGSKKEKKATPYDAEEE